MVFDEETARTVLTSWFSNQQPRLEAVRMGNINQTYRVLHNEACFILQRVNPIFKAEVHDDIARVTARLLACGLATPTLVPTNRGALYTRAPDGGVWRLQTFVDGVVHERATEPGMCRAAGELLGRFHAALRDDGAEFAAQRLGVHDTPAHLRGLQAALASHTQHSAYVAISRVAHGILALCTNLPAMEELPMRAVHGDPKINNIVFAPDGSARALIDLDTLGRMPLPLELGDALRSWCNPGGEAAGDTAFALDFFTAALEGYAHSARHLLEPLEVLLLPRALETISLELAARFARDALEERYFGWDDQRYSAAWEHHLVRANSQLTLARSYLAQRDAATAVVRRLFN